LKKEEKWKSAFSQSAVSTHRLRDTVAKRTRHSWWYRLKWFFKRRYPVVEASLTLSFLHQYQYASGSKSETIDSASPDIRTFDLCFGLDLLHSRKCSPLSHIYVLLNPVCILLQNLSVWETYLCWLFSRSSLRSSPGVSQLFCRRATIQQFEDRTSYAIDLCQDMLHSTKLIHFL